MLTVYFAQQQTPRPLRLADGAKLGFLAGIMGAMIWLVTAAAVDVLMAPLQQRMMDFVLRTARDIPPEARDAMENFGRQSTMAMRLAVGFLFQLFVQTPFAALGGLLGVAMFGQAQQPQHS